MAKCIELTQGRVAIVDDDDFEILNQCKWHYGWGYAKRRVYFGGGRSKYLRMHRVIMNPPDGIQVDHKNGDGLDNRRCNLRIATAHQNLSNQKTQTNPAKHSRYKGVSLARYYRRRRDGTEVTGLSRPWRAYIVKNNRQHPLGNFATQEEAARAYDDKAKELFGEFARLNFPEE